MYTLKVGNRISKRGFLVAGTTAVVTCTCTLRTRNPFSTSDRLIPPIRTFTNHVPGWSTLGDQTGPVDIRGARPLHSGCCEAVLECASHAVDSRIFGSKASNSNKKQTKKLFFLGFASLIRAQTRLAYMPAGVHSSAVEHGIADPGVTGSIPVAPFPA